MYEKQESQSIAEQIVSSRVGMLLAIYEAAIKATDEVVEKLRAEREHEAALSRAQALVLVSLIESGLDTDRGEIPEKIKDLCGFVERSLLSLDMEQIEAAARVLRNLHQGFLGIKDEAIALEGAGAIPRVPTSSVDTIV